jgi:hypothetical protein
MKAKVFSTMAIGLMLTAVAPLAQAQNSQLLRDSGLSVPGYSLRQATVLADEYPYDNASHGLGVCRRGPGELFPMRPRCRWRSEQLLDGIALAGANGVVGELRLRRPSRGYCGHKFDLGRLRGAIAGQEVECERAA